MVYSMHELFKARMKFWDFLMPEARMIEVKSIGASVPLFVKGTLRML